MGNEWVIGLDLGGTKLASALFQKSGDGGVEFVRALENRKYDAIFGESAGRLNAEEKSERIEQAMAAAARELASTVAEPPAAVGICSAGFVERGAIIEAWNTGMKNYPLRDRVAEDTGIPTFLYKDSWAPVYAVRPARPAIIFSIGTGFGGVSCEPDLRIPLLSYTANTKIMWIPFLYANDDPGYAVSFSEELSARLIERAVKRANAGPLKDREAGYGDSSPDEWASLLRDKAREDKRLSPSRIELWAARRLAKEAAERLRPGEVYADVVGAAILPPLAFSWMTGEKPEPPALDALLSEGNTNAVAAFFIQAEFIGYILSRMQLERVENKLAPSESVFGTGSGYNPVTHAVLSRPIVEAMSEYCREEGLELRCADRVEFIAAGGGMPTTLACLGAAFGAARGLAPG